MATIFQKMRAKAHALMVKNETDMLSLPAKVGLSLGIEYVTLKGKNNIQGINFDGRLFEIKWIKYFPFVVLGSVFVLRKVHDFLFRNADETHVIAVLHTEVGNLKTESSSQFVEFLETASYLFITQTLLYL